MKKTLAIILTFALVICMMPASAFAAVNLGTNESIENLQIAAIAPQDYTGTEIKPELSVTATIKGANGTSRQEILDATQYDANYSNNINAGTASVTVEEKISGKGIKCNAQFTINKIDMSNSKVTIEEKTPITQINGAENQIVVKCNGVDVETNEYTATAKNTGNGMVLIEVTANDNAQNFIAGSKKVQSFYVKTMFDNTYTAYAADQTYDGNAKEPTITIKKGNSVINLTKGTDYTVVYTSNVDAGPASFIVTGKNAYYGTITGSFKINPKNISYTTVEISNVTVGQKISVKVSDGNKTLVNGKEYTYVDPDTSVAGSKTLQITGAGNYTGTINKPYTVVGANNIFTQQNVTIASSNAVYFTNNAQYANVVVKLGNTTLYKDRDYKVEYSYLDKSGKTITTQSPKESRTYTVTVTGIGNYAGSAYGSFQILPIPLDWTEIVLGSATVYDTSSRTYVPKVTLRTKSGYTYGYTGNVIIPETDYDVSYRWVNSTSAYLRPTAVVTLSKNAVNLKKASDNKSTEITKEFNTATKNLAYCTASFTDGRSSSAYTGSAVTPKVTVRDGYTTLDPSTYTVTYKNASGKVVSSMRDAGTYTVVIKGNGAYYGELTLTYTITGTDIGNYTVTLKESSVTADGRTKTPVITSVTYGYYSRLSSSDYTVSYQDSTGKEVKSYQMSAPGTYKVVVTGKNGYTGSCYATFTIVGLSQSITGVDGSYKVYPTSETFRLYPKATEGRFTYTSSDPSVASVDAFGNVTPYKAGRAKITISTTGNVRYNPVTTSTVIKVYPNKAAMTRKPWTAGKGKIKVRWNKQDNVTRYEVRYSKNKSFKKGTYKTKKVNAAVNAYTTQSTTLSGLNSGYTYYVKVRAVKEVYNDYGKKLTYYGKWSGWRSVRVK